MIKNVGEFVSLVQKMRDAQKLYFRYRSIQNLSDAKFLEK